MNTSLLREPITPSFAIAAIIHGAILLALGFSVDWSQISTQSVAVTFALTPSDDAPDEAKHLAAADQAGDIDTGAPKNTVQWVTTVSVTQELVGGEASDLGRVPTPDALAKAIDEIEQLMAAISDSDINSEFIAGAVAARRSLDAEYLARWRARVEQMGNALYRGKTPSADADVRLLVSVAADGKLEQIRILRSSGTPELDQAAQNTVLLAAPFPPFSKALAQQTSRLDIVRTWQFRSNALSSIQ